MNTTRKTLFAALLLVASVYTQAQNNTTDEGVLIGKTIWATRNVDMPGTFAENPESPGKFYQWNSTIAWSADDPLTSFPEGKKWDPMWNGNDAETWETANNVCPTGWRLPNNAEITELINAGSSWVTTPANGRLFGNSLFFPAAGHREFNYSPGRLGYVGSEAVYWSSEGDSVYAYFMNFGERGAHLNSLDRSHGFFARCVKDGTDSAVNEISTEKEKATGYFDMLGRKLKEEPARGFYIILYDNGRIEKVMK